MVLLAKRIFMVDVIFAIKLAVICHCLLLSVVIAGELIKLRDIKDFGAKFWLLCVICVTYYVTIFPFISLAL